MALVEYVPLENQIGALPPKEARAGTVKRMLAENLKRELINELSESSYNSVLDRFKAEISTFNLKESAIPLWNDLFPEASMGHESTNSDFEGALCLALQGLCNVLADSRFSDLEDDDLTEEERLSLEKDELIVKQVYANGAIARLLKKLSEFDERGRLKNQGTKDYKPNTEYKTDKMFYALLASILLESLLVSFSDWFEIKQYKERAVKYILVKNRSLSLRINNLVKNLPFMYTLQPLKDPAFYDFYQSPPESLSGSYRLELISYKQTNEFIRKLHDEYAQADNPGFREYIRAINFQQSVAWRINAEVLKHAKVLSEKFKNTEENSGLKSAFDKKKLKQDLFFLEQPLVESALDLLVDSAGHNCKFYLPWKADHRGRIYAETPWLTPQGADLQRALFEFANGHVLTDTGIKALQIHGANLVSRKRILDDLLIRNRKVLTREELVKWILEHEETICDSANNPEIQSFWHEVAGKPWQFLAFCIAYRDWKNNPEALIHLPVQIDGTCNGLQHIAALTRDKALARAVNVLPSEDGLPQDIYTQIAENAVGNVGTLNNESSSVTPSQSEGLMFADRWLANQSEVGQLLNRDNAKKVVMTIPYGASVKTQAENLLESLAGKLEDELLKGELAVDSELIEWVNEKPIRWKLVKQCNRILYKQKLFLDLRDKAFKDKDESAREKWNFYSIVCAYVANALIVHLRQALSALFPGVYQFSEWLGKTGSGCKGLPLVWLTPLGFPVCQDKFDKIKTSISAASADERLRLDFQYLGEIVSLSSREMGDSSNQSQNTARDQTTALLPNLIHSLDASHLAMVLISAQQKGIQDVGSIHDCLLCHADQADDMAEIVSRTFTELYKSDENGAKPAVLTIWTSWMGLLMKIRQLPVVHVNIISGALNVAGGIGEKVLRDKLKRDPNDALIAYSLSVLDEIRQWEEPFQILARNILSNMGEQFTEDTPAPSVQDIDFPDSGNAFEMSPDTKLSPYFFS